METYRDAVFVTDRRSASGYCMYSGTNFVIRRTKKQNAVAQSNTDAEFKSWQQQQQQQQQQQIKKIYAVKNRINLQIVWIRYCSSLQLFRSYTKHHCQEVLAQP
jgi:CobQ-like glutamine amidotransferase family enzyme